MEDSNARAKSTHHYDEFDYRQSAHTAKEKY